MISRSLNKTLRRWVQVSLFPLSIYATLAAVFHRPTAHAARHVGSLAKAVYPAQRFSAAGIERVEITGVRGRLRLLGGHSRSFFLKVAHSKNRRSEDWNLVVERHGSTLVLEVANVTLGNEWRRQVKSEDWPEFDLDLSGPQVPVLINWHQGSLALVRWKADVEASFLEGNVLISGSSGRHRLQVVNADVSVTGFRGQLEIKGERGAIALERVDGNVQLSGLKQTLQAGRVRANVTADVKDVQAKVKACSGKWAVTAGDGRVEVTDFQGRFRGRGERAAWSIAGRPTSDVEVVSQSGPVHVRWNKRTNVFLTTAKGRIQSPYQIEDRDGKKVVSSKAGLFTAAIPAGQVFVRTESGDISFRQ